MYSKVTFAVATIAGLAGRSLANPALPNYDGLIDENGCIISAGLCPWVSPKIATRSDSTFDIAAYCQQSPESCVPVVVDESQVKRSPQEASVNMVGYCKEFPENCVPVVINEDKVKRAS
jgi:hypothetical protein